MIDVKNDTNGQALHIFNAQLGFFSSNNSTPLTKVASTQEIEEEQKLDSRHFGDPGTKSFATHTKEATERSISYFFGNLYNDEYDSALPVKEVESRLKKAARFWGTEDKFYAIKRSYTELKSEMEPANNVVDTVYALKGDKLPISTPEQIEKSAKVLSEKRHLVPYRLRAEAALKIIKAATTHNVDDKALEPYIESLQKIAGLTLKPRSQISKDINARGSHMSLAGLDDEIYKMASEAVKSCSENEIDELCSLLDAYEHTKKASRVRLNPIEDTFFDSVSEDVSIPLSDGTSVSSEAVKQAGLTPFYALGDATPLSVTDSRGRIDLEKAAKFLECIPKEDCRLFSDTLRACLNK
jgi:hypothetical protein